MRARVAATATALALTAYLLYRRRRRSKIVLDATSPTFAADAAAELHRRGYAIIRLTPDDARLASQLFLEADAFFSNQSATRMQHIPPNERGALDSRSGYVAERGREYLELHPRAKAESGGPLPAAPALCAACHAACERVLHALAESNAALATLLSAEAASSSSRSEPGTQPSPRGPMPLGGTTFSASMIRIHLLPDR